MSKMWENDKKQKKESSRTGSNIVREIIIFVFSFETDRNETNQNQ